MINLFEEINFGENVKEKYIDFNFNKNAPLEEQIDLLKEDLCQVKYFNDFLIDIGWYPEFDKNGKFKILVIKNYNWDNPILEKTCRDFSKLEDFVQIAIRCIMKLNKMADTKHY